MLRVFSTAIAGLVVITGLALAADHRGYLKAVGKDKLTVTVEDKDKEKDIEVKTDKTTQFFGGKDAIGVADLGKMIKDAEGKGVRVHIKTKGAGPGEVAAEVRVAGKR